jgi:hypothetical protein
MSYSFDWRCDACERPNQHDFDEAAPADRRLVCDNCGHEQRIAAEGFDEAGRLRDPLQACLACGSDKLYTQKDFNRKLGLAIVLVGAAFSPWTYGLSLVACMAFDYGLYHFVPEITVCYACDAIHRGFAHNPAHRAHDPLLAERFRREARQELGLEEVETEARSNDS